MAYTTYDFWNQNEPNWIGVKEAAVRANCSESTIKRRIETGELPAETFGKNGRKYYIGPADVDRVFVNAKPHKATKGAVANGPNSG